MKSDVKANASEHPVCTQSCDVEMIVKLISASAEVRDTKSESANVHTHARVTTDPLLHLGLFVLQRLVLGAQRFDLLFQLLVLLLQLGVRRRHYENKTSTIERVSVRMGVFGLLLCVRRTQFQMGIAG